MTTVTTGNDQHALHPENPSSTFRIMDHPLHPMLVTLPIGFWMATLLADIGFWWFGGDGWATAGLWLLGAAIVTALLAAIAGLIDFLGDARIRALSAAWQHAIGNVIAVLIACFNFYWRYRYGVSGVLPTGLILSAITLGIILFTGWRGGDLVYRHHVAVN